MCCGLVPHIGPKQSLLDLGGCRKFATTGRRCGAAFSRSRVLAGRISCCLLLQKKKLTFLGEPFVFSDEPVFQSDAVLHNASGAVPFGWIPGWGAMASGCRWLVSLRVSARGRLRLQARRTRPHKKHRCFEGAPLALGCVGVRTEREGNSAGTKTMGLFL